MNFFLVIEGWGKFEFWGVFNFGKFVYEYSKLKKNYKKGYLRYNFLYWLIIIFNVRSLMLLRFFGDIVIFISW